MSLLLAALIAAGSVFVLALVRDVVALWREVKRWRDHGED